MSVDKKFEKILNKTLSRMKAELLELNFPGGKEQARIVAQSLNYLTGGAKQLDELLKLYFDLRVRIQMGHDYDKLYRYVLLDNSRLIHDNNCGLVVAYIILNVKDSFVKVVSLEEANAVVHYIQKLKEVKEEEIDEDDSDFGLVVEKPIVVKGVFGAKEYLSNLRSKMGEDLKWQKRNSLYAKNVNGSIDEYEGYTYEGEKIITIYISILGESTTKKVPKGLVLVR